METLANSAIAESGIKLGIHNRYTYTEVQERAGREWWTGKHSPFKWFVEDLVTRLLHLCFARDILLLMTPKHQGFKGKAARK